MHERLVALRERFGRNKRASKESKIPQAEWSSFKAMLLEHKSRGVPTEEIPDSFITSDELMEVFREMLPVKYPGKVDESNMTEAVERFKAGLEIDRSLVIDKSGKRLMVNKNGAGESVLTEYGSSVKHSKLEREIGTIHTHPVDTLPSSNDIIHMIQHLDSIGFVVTPSRVIAYLRTTITPNFAVAYVARGYLEGMAKSKNRYTTNGIWTPNYQDLSELNIVAYEAIRGKSLFVRKN